jgi:phosphatidylinositol glycan class Q protein
MRGAEPALPYIVIAVSIASSFGATFFCCIVSDILHIATAHLRFAELLVAQVYRWEMANLYSLWNLFRGELSRFDSFRNLGAKDEFFTGKRWNALRDRVDSYDYELDQLFLGTLLFTISLFLLPTVLTYYLFFAMVRFAFAA